MAARRVKTAAAPLRVMFDSNAYDAILAHGDAGRLRALIEAGHLVVITTHIQEDELRRIADPGRRARLLDLFHQLDGRRIDPADVIRGDVTYMSGDKKLAGVAAACCDALVTDDAALAATCPVACSYAAFSAQTIR
jgi:hypothetical protein